MLTAKMISKALCDSQYSLRCMCLENVFIPPSRWECDFLAITKSFYFHEFEIKLSREDYARDFRTKKNKHLAYKNGSPRWPIPKFFYFVVPEGLVSEVPDHCGLISVTEKDGRAWLMMEKCAPKNKHASKLTPQQVFNVGFKATLRLRFHKGNSFANS